MGIAHLDDAPRREIHIGHLRAIWSLVGEAAGSVGIGVRRIQIPGGGWSTPAHEHGRQEEIFYVLEGRGLSWHAGKVCDIGKGDCIVYHAGRGAHTVRAGDGGLDVLAFGQRGGDESPRFPRLGLSLIGNRAVESLDSVVDGLPIQYVRESRIGPPAVPDTLDPRPATVVNLADVEARVVQRELVARRRRNLGRAAGAIATGLQHVEVPPGSQPTEAHCHSVEEKIFVILDGDGVLVLGEEGTPIRKGHVVARPGGTGIAHTFRAGAAGLTFLAYGTRDPADVCYYPGSRKVFFRGLGLKARLEPLDDADETS